LKIPELLVVPEILQCHQGMIDDRLRGRVGPRWSAGHSGGRHEAQRSRQGKDLSAGHHDRISYQQLKTCCSDMGAAAFRKRRPTLR
jgi:hypothetical protein